MVEDAIAVSCASWVGMKPVIRFEPRLKLFCMRLRAPSSVGRLNVNELPERSKSLDTHA